MQIQHLSTQRKKSQTHKKLQSNKFRMLPNSKVTCILIIYTVLCVPFNFASYNEGYATKQAYCHTHDIPKCGGDPDCELQNFVLLTKKQALPNEDYLVNHGDDKSINYNLYIGLSIFAHMFLWFIFCCCGITHIVWV